MKSLLVLIGTALLGLPAAAQFAPQAGIGGSTAIPASSSLFTAWATHCSTSRGLQQIGNAGSGYTTTGDSTSAPGSPNGNVVSLGDSGSAVLTFLHPIVNGPGADFAVFENGFLNPQNSEEAFLELAFVEVSSDGVHYVRFPATSLTPDTFQMSSIAGSTYQNARLLNNLAGKYIANYGTPFDLAELADSANLDINRITHIRIVDCIGDVGAHASRDEGGRKVNDPFPTPFPTGGFDLDAVGVIHQSATGINPATAIVVRCYPNPAGDWLRIDFPGSAAAYILTDMRGRVLQEGDLSQAAPTLRLQGFAAGHYIIHVTDKTGGATWSGLLYRQ